MAKISKRCGCRDANGKQLGAKCPDLAEEGHGKYGFRVSAGSDPNTKARRVIGRFIYESEEDAEDALLEVKQQVRRGKYIFDDVTLSDYLEKWLEMRQKRGLKASTARMYRAYVRNDIVPVLGRVELRKLTKPMVSRLFRDLEARDRGATTIKRIHATLSSAFSDAVSEGEMIENLCAGLRLPKIDQAPVEVWSRANLEKFKAAASAHRLHALFNTALGTGMRRGELCGLRWQDVDFEAKTITVRKNLVQVGKEVVENSAKTKAGHLRKIPMGKQVYATLMEWQLKQAIERNDWADAYQDSGRVFTYDDGEQLRPGYPSSAMMTIVKNAGLPPLKFHGLRHQFASSMLASGMRIERLSMMMGHASINITLSLYSHMVPNSGHDEIDVGLDWMELSDV